MGGGLSSAAESFLDVVKQGRSFSAREPHHCFLNLRDGSFCDVSAVSGLDLRDDGRGVARVDWDRDGDQDIGQQANLRICSTLRLPDRL